MSKQSEYNKRIRLAATRILLDCIIRLVNNQDPNNVGNILTDTRKLLCGWNPERLVARTETIQRFPDQGLKIDVPEVRAEAKKINKHEEEELRSNDATSTEQKLGGHDTFVQPHAEQQHDGHGTFVQPSMDSAPQYPMQNADSLYESAWTLSGEHISCKLLCLLLRVKISDSQTYLYTHGRTDVQSTRSQGISLCLLL